MDVFKPGHQFGDSDFQLNDHNPGISEEGLFWTMPIPPASVGFDLARKRASFCLSDAQMPDFGNLLTSTWGGGAVDALGIPLAPVFSSSVSMDARWLLSGPVQRLSDAVNRFVYDFAPASARIQWRSFRRGAKFESDNNAQEVLFAAVGMERNGSFF